MKVKRWWFQEPQKSTFMLDVSTPFFFFSFFLIKKVLGVIVSLWTALDLCYLIILRSQSHLEGV